MTMTQQTVQPGAILFVCTVNAVRSPMAAALMEQLAPAMRVESAGVRPVQGEPDMLANEAMSEIGLTLAPAPRALEVVKLGRFDLIVTLSPEAQHRALEMTRNLGTPVEYWPTPDPSIAEGSREQRLAAYRAVRDDLVVRLKQRFYSRT
jgi:protein-tyrosine-phosphatase